MTSIVSARFTKTELTCRGSPSVMLKGPRPLDQQQLPGVSTCGGCLPNFARHEQQQDRAQR
jgi:hypothetical protein